MNHAAETSFLPGAKDVAAAYLWGSLVLTGTNALAITLGVPFPEAGLRLRLLHHTFEALGTLGVGALCASLALLCGQVAQLSGHTLQSRRVGALFYACVGGACMWALLHDTFERGAIQFADKQGLPVPGIGEKALFMLFFVLCAAGLPLLHGIGNSLGRRGLWCALPLAVGLAAMGLNRVLLLDAYEDVHTVIQWGAACLVGATLARLSKVRGARLGALVDRANEQLLECISKVRCAMNQDTTSAKKSHGGAARGPSAARTVGLAKGPSTRALTGGLVAFGLVACFLTPPNRVRFELFKDPGAAAAFVLSQTVWQLPSPRRTSATAGEHPENESAVRTPSNSEAGQRRREEPPKRVEAPVVVLVTIDALRGDVLARADLKQMLPNFAELRDTGVYFPNAVSPGSQTSTSLTSLFSGRYFSQLHWQLFGEGYDRRVYAALDPSPRFPELLTKAGVRTVAVLSPGFLDAKYGVVRGFAEQQLVSRRHAHAASTLEPLFERLDSHGLEPGFFYVHLMEAHEPYDRGKVKSGTPFQRYLSEIELLDPWIGRLMARLSAKFSKRGYLVLGADHGEAFGEHATTFHSKTLYNELLHIPLVIWGPGFARRVEEERVGLMDVGPTILDLFGLPSWPGAMGQSLVPLVRHEPLVRTHPLAAEGRQKRACFSESGFKVIEDDRHKTVEIYDLSADPEELQNLFEGASPLVARALEECRRFFREQTLRLPGYSVPYKR